MAEEGTMEKLCPYLFGTCVKHNLFMNFDIQLLYHKKIMYLKMLLIQLDPVLSGNSICEEILVYPLLVTFSRFIHFHGKSYQRCLCMLCVTGLQDKMADHSNVREGLGTNLRSVEPRFLTFTFKTVDY